MCFINIDRAWCVPEDFKVLKSASDRPECWLGSFRRKLHSIVLMMLFIVDDVFHFELFLCMTSFQLTSYNIGRQ